MSFPTLPLRSLLALLFVLLAGLGCPSASTDDDDDASEDDDDCAADDDDATGDDDDTSPTFPVSPLPFSLTLSGGTNETITIDTFGSCQNYNGSSAFRQQWSGGGWVVRVSVVGTYAGAGTYDDTMGASVTLLRNVANGEFFQAGTAQGHTVSAVMEGDDTVVAWGSATVSGMTDTAAAGGVVTLNPPSIPIWCSSIQH